MRENGSMQQQWERIDSTIAAEYSNIDGIAIAQDGTVIHEAYFNGTKPTGRRHMASVTRSVISALIGIAIDERKIGSVDQRVADFFPEHGMDERAEKERHGP